MAPLVAMAVSGLGSILTDAVGEKVKAKILGRRVPDNPGKGLLQSKTIWGGVLLAVGPLITARFDLAPEEYKELVHAIELIVGFIIVWYGRKKASKRALGASN